MFMTIVNIAYTILWIAVIFDWYRLQRVTKKLERQGAEMYQGLVLILYVLGILEPEDKGKNLDKKTGRISLTFNIELLQRVDAKNKHKKGIKNLAKSLGKMVKAKKKGKKK